MSRALLVLLMALHAAAHAASEAPLRLLPEDPGSPLFVLGAEGVDPCRLPLPVALEGAGRDLLLSLDRGPHEGCVPEAARAALRFDLLDMASGSPHGDGLHRVFMIDAERPELSLGLSIVDLGPPVDWRPESGQWWPEQSDDSGPGTGLFIEIQGDALTLLLATYDESGHADWLMAAGRIDGRVFRGELLRFAGGQTPFGDYRAPGAAERVAGVELAFVSPSRAEMWLTRPQGEGVEIRLHPITRFLFGRPADTRAWLGQWTLEGSPDPDLPDSLRFDRTLVRGDGLRVVDATGRFELWCSDSGRSDLLPQRCALLRYQGGERIAEFPDTALDRIDGRDRAGNAIVLRRVKDR